MEKGRYPPLYTQEETVFRRGIEQADLTRPVNVCIDAAGHHVLTDGNHRAFKAYCKGVEVPRRVVGLTNKDVSTDPYYRPISQLRVVDK